MGLTADCVALEHIKQIRRAQPRTQENEEWILSHFWEATGEEERKAATYTTSIDTSGVYKHWNYVQVEGSRLAIKVNFWASVICT